MDSFCKDFDTRSARLNALSKLKWVQENVGFVPSTISRAPSTWEDLRGEMKTSGFVQPKVIGQACESVPKCFGIGIGYESVCLCLGLSDYS